METAKRPIICVAGLTRDDDRVPKREINMIMKQKW